MLARMRLELEQSLASLVKSKYTSAKAGGFLTFSETELAVIKTSSGLPFQLRYCPALAKKPKNNDNKPKDTGKKPDPFEDPPSEQLVAEIPRDNPSHVIVLNKYPVIPEHFILATKAHKEQTHMLETDDLLVTHACLKAWEEGNPDRKLFAFFNSGPHSGASQAHRHLQFLPVDEMQRDCPAGSWDVLTEQILKSGKPHDGEILSLGGLPFAHFAMPLPKDPSGQILQLVYRMLYDAASKAVRAYIDAQGQDLELHASDDGSSPISYNLSMTTTGMAIMPRRREGIALKGKDGHEIGFVALNGTTLGGTMMVKLQEEWDLLRNDSSQLDQILEGIGIPIKGTGQNHL